MESTSPNDHAPDHHSSGGLDHQAARRSVQSETRTVRLPTRARHRLVVTCGARAGRLGLQAATPAECVGGGRPYKLDRPTPDRGWGGSL